MKITPETAEKAAIKDYLWVKGYFVYPNTQGLGCYKGLPDLTAIKDGRVIQIEVKVGGNKQSGNQLRFQEDWGAHGGTYICGDVDEVMRVLK